MADTEATLIDRTGKSIGLKSISPIEHRFLTADLRMRDAIEETDVVIVFQPLTFDSGHSARVSGHPETRQGRLTRARQLEQPSRSRPNRTIAGFTGKWNENRTIEPFEICPRIPESTGLFATNPRRVA